MSAEYHSTKLKAENHPTESQSNALITGEFLRFGGTLRYILPDIMVQRINKRSPMSKDPLVMLDSLSEDEQDGAMRDIHVHSHINAPGVLTVESVDVGLKVRIPFAEQISSQKGVIALPVGHIFPVMENGKIFTRSEEDLRKQSELDRLLDMRVTDKIYGAVMYGSIVANRVLNYLAQYGIRTVTRKPSLLGVSIDRTVEKDNVIITPIEAEYLFV